MEQAKRGLTGWCAATVLVSAFLLFQVQPMVEQDDPALVWGQPGGLDHLHALLSDLSAGGLHVRSLARPDLPTRVSRA